MYFRRIYYKIKYSILNIYYMIYMIFKRLSNIYIWIYSVFFDDTENFEKKYSKYSSSRYKKKKDQQSSSFYTNFDKDYVYKEPTLKQTYQPNIPKDPYEHFFSDCDYTILGVPSGSDFKKVIRPTYIKLINQYHTDKLASTSKKFDKKLYDKISKQINSAYDNLKRKNKLSS